MALLLAPYNPSMRLGQGYNSYFQQPCIDGAVEVKTPNNSRNSLASAASASDLAGSTLRTVKLGRDDDDDKDAKTVQEAVSYTFRRVDKISDIVRGMNVSPACCI